MRASWWRRRSRAIPAPSTLATALLRLTQRWRRRVARCRWPPATTAPRSSCNCATLVALAIGAVIDGRAISQANATCAGVARWPVATSSTAATMLAGDNPGRCAAASGRGCAPTRRPRCRAPNTNTNRRCRPSQGRRRRTHPAAQTRSSRPRSSRTRCRRTRAAQLQAVIGPTAVWSMTFRAFPAKRGMMRRDGYTSIANACGATRAHAWQRSEPPGS